MGQLILSVFAATAARCPTCDHQYTTKELRRFRQEGKNRHRAPVPATITGRPRWCKDSLVVTTYDIRFVLAPSPTATGRIERMNRSLE